jgi:C4-dicarboxylate-specific signal transduction histidine kinase
MSARCEDPSDMSVLQNLARRLRPDRHHLVASSLVALALVAAAHYAVHRHFQQHALDAQALRLADAVARHAFASQAAHEASSMSSRPTRNRAAGPPVSPNEHVERTAAEASRGSGGLYRYRVLSPWSEDVDQWQWARQQARQPAWRFEGEGRARMLHYLREFTPSSSAGAIGAVAMHVPLAPLAASDGTGQVQLLLAIAASSLGIALAGHFAWLGARRERRERDHSEATLLLRTSSLHSALGDTGQAQEFARAALASARRTGLSLAMAASEECMGDVLCAEGRVDEGAKHWRAAVQLLRNHGKHQRAARLCVKLADLSVDKGAGGDAVRWHRRAAELEQRALESGASAAPAADADPGDDRWRSAEMAFHTAKMAAMGRMVAGVNHELKQPLVSLRLLAASALERLDRGEDEHVRRSLYDMLSMTDQIARLTTALDNFSRKQPYQSAPTRLSACVRDALRVLGPQLQEREGDIAVRGVDPEVWVDHDRVRLILVNLLSNALDATAKLDDRRIDVDIREEVGDIVLRVRDFGRGFPPEVQQHLFDMFITTKAEGRGLGLGLALSAKMAREMGGSLSGRNHPQGGAEFSLSLPLHGG